MEETSPNPADTMNPSTTSRGIYDQTEICSIEDQISCEVSDGSILLSLKDGIYYGLNPVGCRIWELIQTPIHFKEIVEILTKEYEVEPGRCADEIRDFLVEMDSKKLIELRNGSSSR